MVNRRSANPGNGPRASEEVSDRPHPEERLQVCQPLVEERHIRFDCSVAEVSGTLLTPSEAGRPPCVIILGGSLSHDRDGRFFGRPVPERNALKALAYRLAAGGYASLRYDKVGQGQSRSQDGWQGMYSQEAQVAAAAFRHACETAGFRRIAIAGESAGAYVACLAAQDPGIQADAYMFLGALCGPTEELYAYNFGRLADYASSTPERLRWVSQNLRFELALGRHYRAMLETAAGRTIFRINDGDFEAALDVTRRREELEMPPDEMFRFIRRPTLCVAGENDLNVPPEHAERVGRILARHGNLKFCHVQIPAADHSFQKTPSDWETRFRERYTMQSFRHPYEERLYDELLNWLHRTIPVEPTRVSCRTGIFDAATVRTEKR